MTTGGTWYDGAQCPIMIPGGGEMWRRCCEPAETNGYCWNHKKGKGPRFDSDFFLTLPKRTAWCFDGETVWVSTDGVVYDSLGKELKGVSIDVTNGIAHDSRPAPPRWTRMEREKQACADSDNE